MRNYSANLYKKFRTRTMNTLDGDNFYEYFMRVVESGVRRYGQTNQLLIKTIDEKWVNAIYDTLDPLDMIVRKPRKFIRREENLLPVEMANKVGPDAVKHLATHSQFISRVDRGGNVIPNKVLNVYNDDSLDIYENRFIITLLNRVSQFIDRRYDAIVGMTGDEFASVLKVESEFNDNDEKIEYDMTIKVHQGQTYLDNENNDPEVFRKIEHIRTMVNSLKKSEFYQSMAGCTQVRSPISKTNLITKEPNFKKCYTLWVFLEQYTEAGYSIERREDKVDFTAEYLDELNTVVLFNYLVMKNHMEDEHNKPIDVKKYKKKRLIKPKFITNIIEELVSDYDIPENQLQQVFQQEISRAYSLKANQEEEIRAALEKALGAEIGKKEEAKQEEQILGILQKALGDQQEKKEEQQQEEQILSLLERTLGAHKEKKEEEKQEEQILSLLQRTLSAHQEQKEKDQEEQSIVSALEQALEAAALKNELLDDVDEEEA